MKKVAFSKRLEWIGRKVASKDAAYPFRRLSYSLRKRQIDRRFPTSRQMRLALFNLPSSDPISLVEHFQRRPGPRWHFDLSEIDEIVARIPADARDRTVSEAEQIANHRFAIMGHEPVRLDPVDWEYSPNEGVAWTRDLNRHACFETLGFAYRYTTDERFAQAFVDLSNSWIDQIAGQIGRLGWDTPFQVARRMNSWIWAFFLFLGSPSWRGVDQRRFLSTLGVLTEYLYHTIEYHSPGNHILLEAKALALCGEVFPEFEGARRWRTKAWKTLSREIKAQICEDGVHVERATMYHRIIAGELAELGQFCSRNEFQQVRELEDVIRRMAEFQAWIDLGGGRYPLFGDSLANDTYYRFSAPVLVAAGSGTQLPLEDGAADHTWWLLNIGHEIKRGTAQEGSKAFPEGGYYVSRSKVVDGTNVLVWDCGPLGYQANRKHAHADALSIVLSVEGVPLLIDPGAGNGLRTTRAHNTVSVDGEDQAVLAERGEIWNPPEPEVVLWSPSEAYDVMWGRHDGYRRLKEPVVHERVIVAGHDGYWLILDRLSGNGVHTAELRYHVAPRAMLEQTDVSQFGIQTTQAELLVSIFGPGQGDCGLRCRREERIGQMHDGRPEVITVLCGTYAGRVPFVLGTFLADPRNGWEMRLIELNASGCALETRKQGRCDRIVVRFGDHNVQPGLEIVQERDQEEFVCSWTYQPHTTGSIIEACK